MKLSSLIKEKFDLIKVILTAVLTLAVTIVFHTAGASDTTQLIVYLLLYILIGYETVIGMVRGFLKSPFNENFLMVAATVGAFIMGEYLEAVVVMLLFAVGELLEEFAKERSENAILTLTKLMPEKATVLVDGKEEEKPVDDVSTGDVLVIKTGDRIVCDGVVEDGSASVDNSMLTG